MAFEKIATFSTLLALSGCVTASGRGSGPSVRRASLQAGIVRVLVEGQNYDYTSPWSKHRPWSRKVNGLVVPGRGILVAGNTLSNHTLLEVQKFGAAKIFPAKIKIVDYEVPLTLLTVEDEAFWKGLQPLPLAATLPTEGEVTIARWLSSGQLEVGQGRLQQVSVHSHWPAGTELLSLDVNTTIDAAGWSEVVLANGEVAGLSTSMAKNRMIAMGSTVVRAFLEQANGEYKGFSNQGFHWQSLNNKGTRDYLNLKPGQGGILVRKVMPKGSVADALKPGDLVLKIDGQPINSAGKFRHPKYGRLFFGALFTMKRLPGERMPIEIIRDGKRQVVEANLRRLPPEDDMIPGYRYDKPPEYLILGGMVFQELSRPFLQTWRDWWKTAPLRMLVAYSQQRRKPTEKQPRMVVLSKVLPDPVNLGYQELGPMIVTKVNGMTIGSIAQLKQAFQKPQGAYHVVEFLPGQGPYRIVLNAKDAAQADGRIRRNYGIR